MVQPRRALSLVNAAINTGSRFILHTDPDTLNIEVKVQVMKERETMYFSLANRPLQEPEEVYQTVYSKPYNLYVNKENLPYHILAATSLNLDFTVTRSQDENKQPYLISIGPTTIKQRKEFWDVNSRITRAQDLLTKAYQYSKKPSS